MKRQEQDKREIDTAAYLDGRLLGADCEALERVLEGDRAEQDALALAKSILQDTENAGEVPERLEQKARELYPRGPDIFDLVVSLAGTAISVISVAPEVNVLAPAAAGAIRGPEAGAFPLVVLTRVFSRARVDVHIERLGGTACTFIVRATDTAGGAPLQPARAEIASGWRELASSPLEQGTALFENVKVGNYDLTIRKNDAVIGRMSIKILGN